jgi:hypothetical protein
VGIQNQGGFVSYTRLIPSEDSMISYQVSSTLVSGVFTTVDTFAVVNGLTAVTPFRFDVLDTRYG